MKGYQNISKRNHFLDLAKAFAIILVVVGHCIQFGSGADYLKEGLYFNNGLFKYIYSFHMPLFMLISGYLFAFSINKKAKGIIINKIRCLIVPIFSWALISLAIFIVTESLKHEFSVISTIKYYLYHCIYSLWFLWAVFWCSLIVVITNRVFKDKIFVYVLIFIVSFFIPDNYNLAVYKFMFPYFVIGYFFNKCKLQENLAAIYNSDYFLYIAGFVFLILLYFFEQDTYVYVSKHTILGRNLINQVYINMYRYLIGLIGSVFTLSLLYRFYNFITKKRTLSENNIILIIGKNTMGIYIISGFLNRYILSLVTSSTTSLNYLIIGIESILIIVISILCIKFIQQYNSLNKCLLGAKNRFD